MRMDPIPRGSPRSRPSTFTEGLSSPQYFEMPPLSTLNFHSYSCLFLDFLFYSAVLFVYLCASAVLFVSIIEDLGKVSVSARTNSSSVCCFWCFGSYSFQAYFSVTFRINPSRRPIQGQLTVPFVHACFYTFWECLKLPQ